MHHYLRHIAAIARICMFACLVLLASAGKADAAEINFLCASAMRSTMQELLPEFQSASGHQVKVDYANIGTITERLRKGEVADLAIVSPQQWEALQRDGVIRPDGRVVISKVGIGVSVRKGASRPDISSLELFKRSLLEAASIAVGDPNQGSPAGVYTAALLDRLGLSGDVGPKLRLIPPGPGNIIADAVAKGGAEIGIDQVPLILASSDVDLVGPFPAQIQNFTVFTAAVPKSAREEAATRDFLGFLASGRAASVFRSKGFIPD